MIDFKLYESRFNEYFERFICWYSGINRDELYRPKPVSNLETEVDNLSTKERAKRLCDLFEKNGVIIRPPNSAEIRMAVLEKRALRGRY